MLRKAEAIVNKREDAHTMDSRDYDDLVYREMRIFKVDYVRTTRKKSIRTYTHKLINKGFKNCDYSHSIVAGGLLEIS